MSAAARFDRVAALGYKVRVLSPNTVTERHADD
jgi:hypothetical protein